MLNKIARILFSIFGGVIGYGIFLLCKWIASGSKGWDETAALTQTDEIVTALIFSILFMFIFYALMPEIDARGKKMASRVEVDLKEVSGTGLTIGVIGLILGLIVASLLTQIYESLTSKYVYFALTVTSYIALGYLGFVIGSRKGPDIINELKSNGKSNSLLKDSFGGGKKKKNDVCPKILDTSVIIDGRILDIMKAGFLEGQIVIPEFVLTELRHIADSSDSLKRNRGRRGLDILNKIQHIYGVSIYDTNDESALKSIPEVDVKLIKLAQIMDGKVVTNDYNLNKVAGVKGVPVLNINELTNALKPVALPGEIMTVTLVKEGKDSRQAVAYLDDGTMIVVEDGKKRIGETTTITVTSVLQTAAGRMIFGRLR